MADVTVKQLAATVGAPVDRLLRQMNEAGLPHTAEEEVVTEEQKQTLLAHLKRSHGASEEPQRKITLKRKSTGTLKAGGAKGGRNVTIEVRRKRTYVKRGAEEESPEPQAAPPAEEAPSQIELEAARIREEEQARKQAEEEARQAEADRKAEAERKAEEEKARVEAERKAEEERAREQAEAAQREKQGSSEKKPEAKVADIQAQAAAEQKGGKRSKTKERGRSGGDFGDNKGRRRELSLKSDRRSRRK